MKTKLIIGGVLVVLIGVGIAIISPLIVRGYKVKQLENYQAKWNKCEIMMSGYHAKADGLRVELGLVKESVSPTTARTGSIIDGTQTLSK